MTETNKTCIILSIRLNIFLKDIFQMYRFIGNNNVSSFYTLLSID